MDLKATYNKIARDWFNDHKESDWWSESALKFLNYLSKGDKILDVGCGGGLKSKYLGKLGFKVVGIDFSEEMIKIAKEHYPEGEFYVKDIKKPIDLGSFDAIFAQAVLLHIPKNEVIKVLENLMNILKPAGYLFLSVKEQRPGNQDERIEIENDYGYDYQRFFSYFTKDDVRKYFSDLHIKILHEDIVINGDTKWIVVIGQK
ncbi:MAG TPA: class I SAM-dependent methyltransferase [Patescibacteria group bacterium]|jgi:2-polyprenyl-3-methyl-5-hydroxy-6-metoxy-1,4-benzoquinol methylase|nr:class I SAM-dependent methyltransferase [Patescibacteria group bacterium]